MRAHIYQADPRKLRHAVAIGQTKPMVAAFPRVPEGLKRGRGAGENDQAVGDLGPHNGQVPGLIDEPVFLLIGAIMFLIDDDQTDMSEGQKER